MSEKYPPAPQCSWTDYYLKYKKKKQNELDKELLIEKKNKEKPIHT